MHTCALALAARRLELDARLDLRDLSKVAEPLTGAAALLLEVSGTARRTHLQTCGHRRRRPRARREVQAPALSFSGRGPVDAHAGRLKISGDVDGRPVVGAAAIGYAEDRGLAIEDLTLVFASARAQRLGPCPS